MTSRDKKLYEVGEITNLMANKDYSKISRKYIKITQVYQKALGTFTDIEAQKEGFKDLADFITYWKKNIGVWNSNVVVWIHEFELIQNQTRKPETPIQNRKKRESG